MEAIETVYKGYRFRSRLEARWAVFFDELNIQWQYETEGFKLETAGYYLPDFHLDIEVGGVWRERYFDGIADDAYIEIKPPNIQEDETERIEDISHDMQLWVIQGDPGEYYCSVGFLDNKDRISRQPGLFYDRGEKIVLCLFPPRSGAGTLYPEAIELHNNNIFSHKIRSAAMAARQARFEHGQIGAPSEWGRHANL